LWTVNAGSAAPVKEASFLEVKEKLFSLPC
jgi:hypothetical protein